MLSLIFLIPIIFAIVLLIFFNKKVVWFEYLILIIPSIIISSAVYFGMIRHSEDDVEYLGEYVSSVKYYEPWDEYIHRTCTRTVGSGKHSHTVSYDCSYVEHHDKEWKQVLSNGYEYSISESEYNRLTRLWKNGNIFIDMHRNFHSYDGDCYEKKWDKTPINSKTVTFEESYVNKVKASNSIFGFSKIESNEAKTLGLYEYPNLFSQSSSFSENDQDQSPFLGYKPSPLEMKKFRFINGYYGNTKQFRTYLLFFYDKPRTIVKDQQSYWSGGNKNEFIICFGIDSKTKNIKWVDCFSWSDKHTLEIDVKSYFDDKEKLNLSKFADWFGTKIVKDWSRKNFSDFDYINVELTPTQLLWLFIVVMLFNIAVSIWVVCNDIQYRKKGNKYDVE